MSQNQMFSGEVLLKISHITHRGVAIRTKFTYLIFDVTQNFWSTLGL